MSLSELKGWCVGSRETGAPVPVIIGKRPDGMNDVDCELDPGKSGICGRGGICVWSSRWNDNGEPQEKESPILTVQTLAGELSIDNNRGVVTRSPLLEQDHQPVELTRTEQAIILLLTREPGKVFSRSQIQEAISPGSGVIKSNGPTVYVARIRRKLGDGDGSIIGTVSSRGYRLAVPEKK